MALAERIDGLALASVPRLGLSRAWAMVTCLALLSVVAFVDRQVLAVVVGDIRRDLGISDVQFGLLMGPAFIITYNISLLVLSVLIDRWNRRYLLVAGVVLWSSMTLLSAFAHDFTHLLVLRSGLAIGEALLGPTAISLIGDLYKRPQRAAPMASYIAGSIVGQNGAAFFGAMALQAASSGLAIPVFGALSAWRLTLVLVAIPGLLLAFAFLFIAREPVRGASAEGAVEAALERETLTGHLKGQWRIYLQLATSMGLLNMLGVSTALWGPAFLMRAFGKTGVSAGYLVGGVSIVTGCLACLAFPWLLKLARDRLRTAVTMVDIALWATVVAVPALYLFGWASNLMVCLTSLAVTIFALTLTSSLVSQFVQLKTPSRLRAKITSGMLFIVFMLAAGVGPVLIPTVANMMPNATNALGHAMGVIALASCVIVLPLMISLRRQLVREAEHLAASVAAIS